MRERVLIGAASLASCLVAGAALYWAGPPPRLPAPAGSVADARAFYASQPLLLRPRPFERVPAGLRDLRAETCGGCHSEIYAEWQRSTHARAWGDDAQFQAELHKHDGVPGRDVAWICVNCHTPLENQLERLVVGLEGGELGRPRTIANPAYDRGLQAEAVTCAVCHVREGTVLGPFGAGGAPHPVRRAPELLQSELCTRCHEASASFPAAGLACAFTTGSEVEAGPRAGQSCQSCHMPEVERPLVQGGTTVRRTRRHWFGGSLIPKRPQDEPGLAPLRAEFPDGVTLSWADLPERAAPDALLELSFQAENAHAAHRVPTGDPERFLLFEAAALGPGGEVLAREEVRVGAVYEWEPFRLISDDRLAPGEVRRFTLRLRTPAAGPLTLRLRASKHRISQANLDYHELAGRTVPSRVYFERDQALPIGP